MNLRFLSVLSAFSAVKEASLSQPRAESSGHALASLNSSPDYVGSTQKKTGLGPIRRPSQKILILFYLGDCIACSSFGSISRDDLDPFSLHYLTDDPTRLSFFGEASREHLQPFRRDGVAIDPMPPMENRCSRTSSLRGNSELLLDNLKTVITCPFIERCVIVL